MQQHQRYVELDVARTLAVLMMIAYHTAYDLSAFYGWDIDVFEGGWKLLARATASLFLLLVGVGFAISWERNRGNYAKYMKRGLGLIALGMIVSLVTYVIEPNTYIRFGILHLIGTGILLLPLFVRFREWNILLGIGVILLGMVVRDAAAPTSLLLPLGVRPLFFSSVDYFPLLPWFGVMLIGYTVGHYLYVHHDDWRSKFSILHSSFSIPLWPGRNALAIYFVHQPLIIAVLWLLLGSPFR